MTEISQNTKLEIAVEIMAAKIAENSRKETVEAKEKVSELIKERNEMYKGNEEIINKIINQYGPEIKNNYYKI